MITLIILASIAIYLLGAFLTILAYKIYDRSGKRIDTFDTCFMDGEAPPFIFWPICWVVMICHGAFTGMAIVAEFIADVIFSKKK